MTGFDKIAQHMRGLGYSVSPIQNEGGHYLPSAIISSINNMTIAQKSKSCSLSGASDYVPPKLTIGNLVIELPNDSDVIEGDVYIDVNGNITTSWL